MKTKFTEQEIIDFFQKKKDEIVGEEILSRVPPDYNDFPKGFDLVEVINFVYKQGLKQGKIEGNVEVMNELIKFFEL
jgi:hypothetical protein